MATVYSYIRFSTRKQEEGDSLRRQVELSNAWIKRNGHTLATKELHDLGRSGFHGRNLKSPDGKLREFLGMIESGRVRPGDILLVECLDRLSRQAMSDAKKMFEAILEAGVLLVVLRPYERVFTKDSIADPFGLMEPLMAFHLAHLESKNKSDRLKSVREHQRTRAIKEGSSFKFDGRGPSWLIWDANQKVFEINRDAADAIKFIFESTASGMGQRAVLTLVQKNFKAIGTSGRWNSSFIQKVLSDKSVLGIRQPMTTNADGLRVPIGPAIQDYYPAVITQELWHRAQSVKDGNKRKKGPSGKFVNLFSGLVKNAKDGHPMHIQTTRNGEYLQRRLVSYGHVSKVEASDSVSVDYFSMESMLLSQLSEIRMEDLRSGIGASELRVKRQELTGIEVQLRRIETDLASADADEYETLRNAAKIARNNRDRVRKEAEKLQSEINADKPLAHAKELMGLIANASGDEKQSLRLRLRALIGEFVEAIHLKPEKHFGRVYCICQVTYVGGMVRQFGWGPGWKTNGSGKSVDHCCLAFTVDLRDQAACQPPLLAKIAGMLTKPAERPVDMDIPSTVGAAAQLFLRIRRSELTYESFKTFPSKISRFVEFSGADTPVSRLRKRDLEVFQRWLSTERLADSTSRVTMGRVREFLRWLRVNDV